MRNIRIIMRKIFLLFLCLGVAMISKAADPVSFNRITVSENQTLGALYFCDKEYKAALVSGGSILIYSADLEVVKTINVSGKPVYPIYKFFSSQEWYTGENDYERVYATQYLFNDDDLFEYICFYENADGSRRGVIYNEKGESLGNCPSIAMVMGDDFAYFLNEDDNFNHVYYTVKHSGNNKVKTLLIEAEELIITPNPSVNGETVTVKLENGEIGYGYQIKIYSMNGTLLYQATNKNNENGFSFSSDKLTTGTNLIMVENDKEGIVGTGKALKK